MKAKAIILISIVFTVFLLGCTTNSLKSGITGTLQYGEGNCVFDANFRTYTPYSGYVFFVNKAVKDTTSLSLPALLSISDSTNCNVGKFKQKLEVGVYYLCIRVYLYLHEDNFFTINPNETTEQNFWTFKCI